MKMKKKDSTRNNDNGSREKSNSAVYVACEI